MKTPFHELASGSPPWQNLLRMLIDSIVWQLAPDGQEMTFREKSASVLMRTLDEEQTQKHLSQNLGCWQEAFPDESLPETLTVILGFIKEQYLATHDGFRLRKNPSAEMRLNVDEVWAVSKIAEWAFGSVTPAQPKEKTTIGIGVIQQGIQDAGKNLVKAVWQAAGFEVVDFGRNLPPEQFAEAAAEKRLSALGISCMTYVGAQNLPSLAEIWRKIAPDVPLIIGGIAVNPLTSMELAQQFDLRVSYGRDAGEAVAVLQRTLDGKKQPVAVRERVNSRALPGHLKGLAQEWGLELFDLPVRGIQLTGTARAGCAICPPEKKNKCPLVLGFEKEHSLEESREFLRRFSGAVLVKAGLPGPEDVQAHRDLWNALLGIESWVGENAHQVYGFRFPIPCPYCSEKNCTLAKGYCQNAQRYRSIPETWCIDIPATVRAALGDDELTGMFGLICSR